MARCSRRDGAAAALERSSFADRHLEEGKNLVAPSHSFSFLVFSFYMFSLLVF